MKLILDSTDGDVGLGLARASHEALQKLIDVTERRDLLHRGLNAHTRLGRDVVNRPPPILRKYFAILAKSVNSEDKDCIRRPVKMDSTVLMYLTALVAGVVAYPRGAMNNASNPVEALSSFCTTGNFRPNHGDFLPQATPAPYTIKVFSPSGQIYKPGQAVSVTIESTAAGKLKGFFLQGDATEASFAGDLNCAGYGHQVNFCGKSGITHSDATPKTLVQCTWTPPDFQIGQVQFTATIVENFSTFWTGVKSEVNLSPDPTTMTYEQKSLQLREQLMSQFQHGAPNLANRLQSQLGPNGLSGLFGQSQKQGQSSLPGIVNNLSSWFGGQGQANSGNSNSNNNQPFQNSNAFALSRNAGLSQFQQFFGGQ
ncbi:hypothetical protein RRG08_007671 [Elysia crispata]|uniref:Reelin domain-containing protein n=1 Tax=Elysia crispata TaxID=231223 RepID=A0AAE0Y3T6_9GAST|nr:hypothetical protein RRG08_007671 [Elysia crispata]